MRQPNLYYGENMNHLICPKCRNQLLLAGKSCICENNHCYDFAKEGYVNLLSGNKNGSLIGDNKDMALSRRDFLNKGYFKTLAEAIEKELQGFCSDSPFVLDICCGEGYYSSYLKEHCTGTFTGFDISKEMVRLAAKKKSGVSYFVANMTDIPIESASVDFAFHLFAPFYEKEFYRILNEKGILISVTPGKRHLFSLKEVLYDTPYENDELPPEASLLKLKEQKTVKSKITLETHDDIISLFKMTPYYYHTSDECKKRLDNLTTLQTEIEFVLNIYTK